MNKVLVTSWIMIQSLLSDYSGFVYAPVKPGFYSFDTSYGRLMDIMGTMNNPVSIDSIIDSNSIMIYCVEVNR